MENKYNNSDITELVGVGFLVLLILIALFI